MIKDGTATPAGTHRLVLRLVRAAAYAAHSEAPDSSAGRSHGSIRFLPLAASAGPAGLPSRLVASEGGLVEVEIATEGSAITFRVRALGYATVKRMRLRRGRLVTSDGAVDHLAEFDGMGECVLSLVNSGAVVTSLLGGFDIVMDG